MKVKELLEYGRNNLTDKQEPNRLSKILLKNLLEVEDSYLVIHYEEEVSEKIQEKFKSDIQLLNSGKPIQYITNKTEFMKLNFYVDENVLIPQPDTEILVEEVFKICNNKNLNYNILDLCTGSGAIGISLAKYIQNSKVVLSDISNEALNIAKKNAAENNVVDKCLFLNSDMFKNIEEKFDIIVSNPPYIKTDIISTLDKEVQNEPVIALDGGKDGLEFYKIIADEAWKFLKSDGVIAVEIGFDQKNDVINLIEQTGKYKDIYSKKDLSGNDRIIVAKHKNLKEKIKMNSSEYIGKIVEVEIDRPKDSAHPKYPDFIYPINYGYVPNTISGDGKELDCFILGVDEPIESFKGRCIAVIHRTNDDDDKLIIVPDGIDFTDNEIRELTYFQEKYFESVIIRKNNL